MTSVHVLRRAGVARSRAMRRGSPLLRRATAVAIVALLGLDLAVVTGAAASTDPQHPRAPAAASSVDRVAITRAAARLARDVDLELSQPAAPPEDARAPTPDVRLARIELPAIGVSDVLYEGVTLTSIDRGPSHWPGSALPGELGNVVVAGHRTTHSRPVHALDRRQPGDRLVFTPAEGRFVYALTRTEVVPSDALHIVDQRYGHTATLFACHPKGSARFRIVGRFRLVDTQPAGAAAGGA